jgi:CheY-like chemotaxis protein/HPt (histidine-containing phosphotransfer) domain-containing protein
MARESAESLLGLVDDLLDVAKAESGRLSCSPAPMRLRQVLSGIMRLMVHRGSAKGLAVRWRVAEDVPDLILADGARLRQVIANLIGNALKYTRQGFIELEVDRIGAAPQARLRFVVRDTGCGIPPERWPEVFQPFVRLDSAADGGTGLGLTISASLVELMGGRLLVSSEPGAGTQFGFTIPLTEVPPEQAPPDPPQSLQAAERPRLGGRILVAEDNPLNRQVIRGLLEKEGFSVTLVSDGEAAVREALSGACDLVLMDVQMPGMDGLEAARAIRAQEPPGRRIPILAMTARAMEEDAAACRAAGMDGYLAKPVRISEVLAALAEHLPGAPLSGGQPRCENQFVRQSEQLERNVKYMDVDGALDRLGGDRELLAELAGLFCEEGPRLLGEAEQALAAGDAAAAQNAAHQLKGLLAQFCAADAREAAWQLELEARRADLMAAKPRLEALRARLGEVLPELRRLAVMG